ncbi:hypothetical protein INT43_003324, partial [Umbelopsis isabellina]
SLPWLTFGKRQYSTSSKKWLSRQANDRFVKDARAQQYRARSAFKLIQLNEKHRFLKKGFNVIELGASPGGWTQVIAEKVFSGNNKPTIDDSSIVRTGTVIAVDLLPTEPIPGVNILQGNFLENNTQSQILHILNGKEVDAVLSDMAPSFSGNHHADHAKSMELCNISMSFAVNTLKSGGVFVCKFLMGGDEVELKKRLRTHFQKVKHEKPSASRKESTEGFLVATGFRGDTRQLQTDE